MHITILNIGSGHCALHAWMVRLPIDASSHSLMLGCLRKLQSWCLTG